MSPVRNSHRKPRVCIVGAGIAGLRCADVLLRNEIDVTILEAKHQVGGRVCQAQFDGQLIDLGPNWIHGTEDNPIYEIAKQSMTLCHSWDHGRTRVIDELGKEMDHQRAERLSTAMWELVGAAYEYSRKKGISIPVQRSLAEYLQNEGRIFLRSYFADGTTKEATFSQRKQQIESDVNDTLSLSQMWGGFVGTEYERQSLRFFWLEEMVGGENPFVASTYKDILAHIAEYPISKADVHLSEPVIKVSSIANTDGRTTKVEVRTMKNLYAFDEVVVTAPLGWLKRNTQVFSPAMEPRLASAVKNISYGNLEKIYVKFAKAWWDKPPKTIASAHGLNLTNQPPSLASLSLSDQPASFTHWLKPLHKNVPNAQAVSLYALPSSLSQPTLLFYTFGITSEHNHVNLVRYPSAPEQYRYLTSFLKPYYSSLPNYDPSSTVCVPVAIYATSWSEDIYAGYGSYSNFQVGVEEADRDVEAMRDGMPDRRVWLAGEHTAPLVATGTTTGAYWSGEETAKRMLDAYGRKRVDHTTLPEAPERVTS